jgi:hypothetical protein
MTFQERGAVVQTHTGVGPATAEGRQLDGLPPAARTRLRQGGAQRILDHCREGPPAARRELLGAGEEIVVEANRRAHDIKPYGLRHRYVALFRAPQGALCPSGESPARRARVTGAQLRR